MTTERFDYGRYKGYLRSYVESITRSTHDGHYVCPFCGSGTGANKSAAFSIMPDGEKCVCFACMDPANDAMDIFDLYAKINNCDHVTARQSVADMYGIQTAPQPRRQLRLASPQKRTDFSAYINRCAAALPGSKGESYLIGRGLTSTTIARFCLGYDSNKDEISIPYSDAKTYYAARPLHEADYKYRKPSRAEAGGAEPVFNPDALYASDVCFVVESQLCAISIEQEGGHAIAIGGQGSSALFSQLAVKTSDAILIVCLDNDDPGRKKAPDILAKLVNAGCRAVIDNSICGDAKDPNDALQADAEAFRQRISASISAARRVVASGDPIKGDDSSLSEEDARAAYMTGFGKNLVNAFVDHVNASVRTPAIPTGFIGLDERLDGGLYAGLYVVGAISSLGKTTFVLQIADQIAAAGQDVLVFSLEMSKYELIAKSISRYTYQLALEYDIGTGTAKTTRGILAGQKYAGYTDMEKGLIRDALDLYRRTSGEHICISEGVGNIGITEIRQAVIDHIRFTGNKPVVIIDYLQIIAPSDVRASDKQNTDKAVLELKRLSRDNGIPVIGISSFNRDNYTAPVNMAAFKESGAIEYSSDVLIGLQYTGMDYKDDETDKAREKRIRELRKTVDENAAHGKGINIDLKILKNRNGKKGAPLPFTMYPMFNAFDEGHAFVPGNLGEEKPKNWRVL